LDTPSQCLEMNHATLIQATGFVDNSCGLEVMKETPFCADGMYETRSHVEDSQKKLQNHNNRICG